MGYVVVPAPPVVSGNPHGDIVFLHRHLRSCSNCSDAAVIAAGALNVASSERLSFQNGHECLDNELGACLRRCWIKSLTGVHLSLWSDAVVHCTEGCSAALSIPCLRCLVLLQHTPLSQGVPCCELNTFCCSLATPGSFTPYHLTSDNKRYLLCLAFGRGEVPEKVTVEI